MATNVTLTLNGASTNVSLSTGGRGPAGAAGSDANVTNANVNAAIATSPSTTRTSLGLGTAATVNTGTTEGTIPVLAANGAISIPGGITSTGGSIYTQANSGIIETSGTSAFIQTTGSGSVIRTTGANAHIFTDGDSHIQSRTTFKLHDGTYTTTLSHSPTANRTITLPDESGTVVTDQSLSLTGGSLKIPKFDSNADLTTGAYANDNVIMNPGGNIIFPDKRGITWLQRDGGDSGAQVYMWEDHDAYGGELIVESPNRIAFVQGESGAIQIGLVRGVNNPCFTYLQSKHAATASYTQGNSQPLYFNSNYWNGSASTTPSGFVAIQGIARLTDGQQELIFSAGGTFPGNTTGSDGTRPEIAAITPEGIRDPYGNSPAFVALTDGATVTLTCSTNKSHQNHFVTLAGNRTLAFSGVTNGMRGTIIVSQDGTGSRTLTLPTNTAKQAAFAISTGGYKVDVLNWFYTAGEFYFDVDADYVLSLDAAADVFLTATGISAASTEGIAINNLVKQLKADDVWDELIAAYPLVGGNSADHAIDIKATYNATFGAGVTHDANGITGSAGATGWMNTGINISSLGIRDSVGLYCFNRTASLTASGRIFGTVGTNGRFYVSKSGGTLFANGPMTGSLNTLSVALSPDDKGHFYLARTGASATVLRKDSNVATGTEAAVTAPTAAPFFLAQNDSTGAATNPTNANLAFAAVTTGGIDSTKYTALCAAVNAFNTALSRNP